MPDQANAPAVYQARLGRAILVVRGCNVILDAELAELYGVPTKRLNEQVRRNKSRFPPDFMFALSAEEKQEVVAICDHLPNLKFSATLPNVFTEHGAIMAANVLNSDQAVEMSVHIVRTFIRLRQAANNYQELAQGLRQSKTAPAPTSTDWATHNTRAICSSGWRVMRRRVSPPASPYIESSFIKSYRPVNY